MALVCHTWLPWYSKSEELFEHVSDLHECSTCFWEFADLTQHKKRCQPTVQPLQFQCCFCYASFANYKHLLNHVRSFHFNICEKCNVRFETKEELDTHVWQIHQSKTVEYVLGGLFWGFLGCVLGGILEGVLGGILMGAVWGILGAAFFEKEEDLNQHQGKFIPGWSNPTHTSGPEWKPKKNKTERRKQNRKRRKQQHKFWKWLFWLKILICNFCDISFLAYISLESTNFWLSLLQEQN